MLQMAVSRVGSSVRFYLAKTNKKRHSPLGLFRFGFLLLDL
jgi:hypothetical protein